MSILDQIDDDVLASIKKRVDSGAEFLDEVLLNWYRGINIRRLSMSTPNPNPDKELFINAKDGYGCVLCQLDEHIKTNRAPIGPIDPRNFGSYSDALYLLDIEDYASKYGFDTDEEELSPQAEYQILDILWTELIEERLAND